jgi:dTDP-4-dehydrorhamnose reductase
MFLFIGGDSEIGAAAARAMKALGQPVVATTRRPQCVGPDRPLLDLAFPLSAWEPPRQTTAACICAAAARISDCARDPVGTNQTNVNQTLTLIEKLLARDIYVLFLSSNQVFDGYVPHVTASAPYSPVSEYGHQKMRTELALRGHMSAGAPVAILRLAKVISPDMPLLKGWIDDLLAGKPVEAFTDMTLAPTPVDLVCATIGRLLLDRLTDIFQITGPRDLPYFEVGSFIAEYLCVEPSLVKRAKASEAKLPKGATPLNTTLDSSLLRALYGISVPDPLNVVESVLALEQRRLSA